jgi:hypothetical protein
MILTPCAITSIRNPDDVGTADGATAVVTAPLES